MRSLGHDIRLALRRLRLAPGFTLFAVLSLALGIGVTTVVYSALRTVFWQPLGVPTAAQLLAIRPDTNGRAMSWPDFLEFRRKQTRFRTVAASVPLVVAVGAGPGSQAVPGAAVSGDYFTVIGVTPKLGRLLDRSDEAGSARIAVVSESFWRTHLASDRRRIGGLIKLGGEP